MEFWYAKFQNAGYMGLYGGLTVDDIHKRKGLREDEKILDFMGSTELIANLFIRKLYYDIIFSDKRLGGKNNGIHL